MHKIKSPQEPTKTRYERPKRQIKKVDFQRIEEAPINRFELEVQKKIGVRPEALSTLIHEEEKELLKDALRSVSLSERERISVGRSLAGQSAPEIAEVLGVETASIHLHLRRAASKLKAYLKRKGKL